MPNEDKLVLVLHEMQHALVGMQQLLGVHSNIILQLLKETPEKSEFAKSLAFNQSFAKASMENLKEWNRAKENNWEAHSYRVAVPIIEKVIKTLDMLQNERDSYQYELNVPDLINELRRAIGEQEAN